MCPSIYEPGSLPSRKTATRHFAAAFPQGLSNVKTIFVSNKGYQRTVAREQNDERDRKLSAVLRKMVS